MYYKQNLHTHTTYVDGAHTPRQMIEYAIGKGFDSIGFSEHSPMYFAPERAMSEADSSEYKKEIYALKEEYKDRIRVFCGLEYEMYSEVDTSGYEYLIGDTHFLRIDGALIGFDRAHDEVERVINTYFGGDGLKYALKYWHDLAELPSHGNFDIIGHFDLITKHSEKFDFFNPEDPRYLKAAVETMDSLKGKIPFFEVNTGAIGRGYRTMPYPSVFLLKEFQKMGFGAVITTDCHNGEKLDIGFELARKLLAECGFKERYCLTDSGFEAIEI